MPRTPHPSYDCAEGCSVEAALSVIGGKWKGTILYRLHTDGTLRFNQIRRIHANRPTARIGSRRHHFAHRVSRSPAACGIPANGLRQNACPRADGIEGMGRRLKRKPRGRQGVEWQHRKASEIFKDDEKAACTHGRNRNAAAGEIGAVGNAGSEAERGVILRVQVA